MIGHDEARMAASARADGEPYDAAVLGEHLVSCAECRAYADGVERLRALVTELPREAPPEWLPMRVRARIERTPRARWSWRLAPVLAALAALVVVVSVVGPPGRFALPRAAASEALTHIHTLYVEREIEETVQPLDRGPVRTTRTTERIWYRAPAFLFVEREIRKPDGTITQIREMTRPGERYIQRDVEAERRTGLAPDASLPEPLSITLALVGRRVGPGPSVSGRPTIRYEATFGDRAVSASVDAERYALLDQTPEIVVQKDVRGGRSYSIHKRVVDVGVNIKIASDRFVIPDFPSTDEAFVVRPVRSLAVRPDAVPEGFTLVRAGSAPDGDSILYARGAFPLLVQIGHNARAPRDEEGFASVRIGARTALVRYGLYAFPRLQLTVRGRPVAVTAPLPPQGLADLVARMFPGAE